MTQVRISKFTDDVTILAMGSLFRKLDGVMWGINLQLAPDQGNNALMITNAPILARRRVLNQNMRQQSKGYRRSFVCRKGVSWGLARIGDIPASWAGRSFEKEQWCFKFTIDADTTVFLPQFELARVLFLHNAYLARTALDSDCLKAEFDVNVSAAGARINVLPSSSYPLRLFNNPNARKMLSWLLLDPNARVSYESIGRNQKLYGRDYNGYRHWDFQFTPPPLTGAQFDLKGFFDQATKSFFVHEILNIKGVQASVPDTIAIHHPKFKEGVSGGGGHPGGYGAGNVSEYDVEDDGDANSDNEHYMLPCLGRGIEFDHEFKAVREAESKHVVAENPDQDEEGIVDSVLHVSTDEPTESGTLPSADWDAKNGCLDDEDAFISRFEGFVRMLDKLEKECEVIDRDFRKFPALPRFKRHFLSDGETARRMAIVKLKKNNKILYLLEVDTSDAITPISSRLVYVPSLSDEQVNGLMKELMRNSMHWPVGKLTSLCGSPEHHKGISHPKADSSLDKGILKTDSIEHWAERVLIRANCLIGLNMDSAGAAFQR